MIQKLLWKNLKAISVIINKSPIKVLLPFSVIEIQSKFIITFALIAYNEKQINSIFNSGTRDNFHNFNLKWSCFVRSNKFNYGYVKLDKFYKGK